VKLGRGSTAEPETKPENSPAAALVDKRGVSDEQVWAIERLKDRTECSFRWVRPLTQ
jgi:hypothetical protein